MGVVEGVARVVKSAEEIERLASRRHSGLPGHEPELDADIPENPAAPFPISAVR